MAGGLSTRFPLQNLDFPSSMLRGHLLFVEANQLRAYDLTTGSGRSLYSVGHRGSAAPVAATDAASVYLTSTATIAALLSVSNALTLQVLATESGHGS